MAQSLSVASPPEAKAQVLASSDQTHLAILPQPPPTASMIIGMNVMPWASHWVRVSLFQVLVAFQNAAGVTHRVSWQVSAQPRRDGEVPGGGRAQPPPRDIHVGRATGTTVLLADAAPTLVSGTV